MSTDEPVTSGDRYDDTTKLYTSPNDGYVWRHMYNLRLNDYPFISSSYIPIPTTKPLEMDPYNPPIEVLIRNSGAGLGDGTYYIRTTNASRRGGSAIIEFVVSSGVVTTASIASSSGDNFDFIKPSFRAVYSDAAATTGNVTSTVITTSSTLPILEIVVPPMGGYGSDVISQLCATTLLVHLRVGNTEQEVDFPVNTTYSQVGLMIDPLNPTIDGQYAIANTLSATNAVALTSVMGTFEAGERITQINARGIVIEWLPDSGGTSGVLKYIQPSSYTATVGNNGEVDVTAFTSSNGTITGAPSGATGTVDTSVTGSKAAMTFSSGIAAPELEYMSGTLLSIANRRVTTRNQDQVEDITLSFAY